MNNTPDITSAGPRPLRPFHTPVRGHTFSARPAGGAPLDRSVLRLRVEPDNPADPHAVAVWADGGGTPWRVGYLERAVAIRIADRITSDAQLAASFAGWLEEPEGRWQRPLVRLRDEADAQPVRTPAPTGLRALPPASVRRTRAA